VIVVAEHARAGCDDEPEPLREHLDIAEIHCRARRERELDPREVAVAVPRQREIDPLAVGAQPRRGERVAREHALAVAHRDVHDVAVAVRAHAKVGIDLEVAVARAGRQIGRAAGRDARRA
jgi:hypothetical protein